MSNLLSTTEPHCLRLEEIASELEAAGIGCDPNNGHIVTLRRMASEIRSQAARGRLSSGGFNAAAEQQSVLISNVLAACADAGIRVPAGNKFSIQQLDAELDRALATTPAHLKIQKKLEFKARLSAAAMIDEAPFFEDRMVKLAVKKLQDAGIPIPDKFFTIASLNAAMEKAGLSISEKFAVKETVIRAGMLDKNDLRAHDVAPPASPQHLRVSRSIFQQIGIDEPSAGKRLNLAKVDAAMKDAGIPPTRSMAMKQTLAAAGFLD